MTDEIEKAKLEAEKLNQESKIFTVFIQGYHQAQIDDKNNERFEDADELRKHLRDKFNPEEII